MEKECVHCTPKSKPFYKEPLLIVLAVLLIGFLLSWQFPALQSLYAAFFDYLEIIWLPVLAGFIIGGLIDYFIPHQYIAKYLGQRKKRAVFYSVTFGFLMSACSHGILAIALELYKKGASTSSVIAFLLASPWANLPVTLLLFGLFGTKAFLLIICAIIFAINTGLIFQVLERKGLVERNKVVYVPEDFSIKKDIERRIVNYRFDLVNVFGSVKGVLGAAWDLARTLLWWLLVGVFIASLAQVYIPQGFFEAYMGPTFLGMLAILALAIVIEVCSEGSAPLAFEIFRQTQAFGNSFVYLMAGVALDYTEVGIIWKNIGRKTALWLLIINLPQILIAGYLLNIFV